MNGFVIASRALVAAANFAEATLIFGTVAATGTTVAGTTLSLGTLTGGGATALALGGGVLLIKALAIGALAIAASRRSRRSVLDDQDAAFAVISGTEPAQCYRRLICDLATGTMPQSENDIIVSLFDKESSIDSHKFEYSVAAKLGKQIKSVQMCEVRYSCPLTGSDIQKLFN
jgi:hypothetical protein